MGRRKYNKQNIMKVKSIHLTQRVNLSALLYTSQGRSKLIIIELSFWGFFLFPLILKAKLEDDPFLIGSYFWRRCPHCWRLISIFCLFLLYILEFVSVRFLIKDNHRWEIFLYGDKKEVIAGAVGKFWDSWVCTFCKFTSLVLFFK